MPPPRPIEHFEEPETIWPVVSRFAGALIVLVGLASLAVPFFPKLEEFRKLNEEGRHIEELRDRLKLELEEKRLELEMTRSDPQFIEIQARDHLDLYREGEVVFRFEDRR